MKRMMYQLTRYIIICMVFVSLLLFIKPEALTADKVTICFYSSETNINNFKSLKMGFDTYLSKFGPYEFQPFNEREAFEREIKNKKSLIVLSSWHYNKIYKVYSLIPSLIGMRGGKSYQKRILVATPKFADLKFVRIGPIASASNIQHTKSVLNDMLKEKGIADAARILTVPKDVDALMSVGFEMAKSAMITENALDNLKMIDPLLYKKMKVMAKGSESFLLVLAVPEDFTKETEKLIHIIQEMPKNSEGMNLIKMIDLDGWKMVNPSDKLKLEG